MNRDYEDMERIMKSIEACDMLVKNYMQYISWATTDAEKAKWQAVIQQELLPLKQKLEDQLRGYLNHINKNILQSHDNGEELDSPLSTHLIV